MAFKVSPMTDEIDPDLRRLFAATADPPADEAFVAAVTARTARLRLLTAVAWGLGLILLAAALAVSAPVFGRMTAALALSPFGWVAGLALAGSGALCARVLAAWRSA
jgi:hypothetical protein